MAERLAAERHVAALAAVPTTATAGLASAGLATASTTLAALNEAVFATPMTRQARVAAITTGGGMRRPA